ncbi:hypothetical protein [Pseudomonas sp. MF6747]|uniref:hypothetical protein n=1 Tax=Pseudomonas sp. MF6747 TaxID=2797527 RepID=UPI00190DA9DE|nr:hypothetical protein [Pseudomonas sp. MF6747]MBK3510746.1 hypothetical protein [Pseudomonas sp. MF6747]
MDDESVDDEPVSPEVKKYLSEPMTRLEVVNLVQPLRGALIPLISASMNSLAILTKEASSEESRKRAKDSYHELGEIFTFLDKFDATLDLLLDGKETVTHGEEADDE